MHFVFVAYYSFASNSSGQMLSLANELSVRGHSCTIFVPFDKATVASYDRVHFEVREYSEVNDWLKTRRNGGKRYLVVAWTPRENVRLCVEQLTAALGCRYLVHLEDNEYLITAVNLGLSIDELMDRSEGDLDAGIKRGEGRLSHPHRVPGFIQRSAGISGLIDKLAELAPVGHPSLFFFPGYNPELFRAMPTDYLARRALGIDDGEFVIVYTGNAHSANRQEVLSLYLAVALLNRTGCRARLVRAGEDYTTLITPELAPLKDHAVELGKIGHRDIPGVLSMADAFVQPGRIDPFNNYRFPSKVPEFFAIGRPVIIPAANLGRFVRDGEDCLVLKRGDCVEIAERVMQLARSPELATKLAAAALQYANRHFRWAEIAQRFETFGMRLAS